MAGNALAAGQPLPLWQAIHHCGHALALWRWPPAMRQPSHAPSLASHKPARRHRQRAPRGFRKRPGWFPTQAKPVLPEKLNQFYRKILTSFLRKFVSHWQFPAWPPPSPIYSCDPPPGVVNKRDAKPATNPLRNPAGVACSTQSRWPVAAHSRCAVRPPCRHTQQLGTRPPRDAQVGGPHLQDLGGKKTGAYHWTNACR